jgi:hypothetical protein
VVRGAVKGTETGTSARVSHAELGEARGSRGDDEGPKLSDLRRQLANRSIVKHDHMHAFAKHIYELVEKYVAPACNLKI